jgi:hypothetical protein
MTRNIIKPVTKGGPAWSVRTWDADAVAYIRAVESADVAQLPAPVSAAINAFVVGCKADGIWDAIKAACFLAGPRTLTGSLVPLAGTAPTNFNFVSGDYAAKTGLKGDGINKRLGSNRNNNADPQDSKHLAVWVSETGAITGTRASIGVGNSAAGTSHMARTTDARFYRLSSSGVFTASIGTAGASGFIGASRSSSTGYVVRLNGENTTATATSSSPLAGAINVFARTENDGTSPISFSLERLAWYSIGEAINLALIEARIAAYMAAINGANY